MQHVAVAYFGHEKMFTGMLLTVGILSGGFYDTK